MSYGAGDGNRTHVRSLGSLQFNSKNAGFGGILAIFGTCCTLNELFLTQSQPHVEDTWNKVQVEPLGGSRKEYKNPPRFAEHILEASFPRLSGFRDYSSGPFQFCTLRPLSLAAVVEELLVVGSGNAHLMREFRRAACAIEPVEALWV